MKKYNNSDNKPFSNNHKINAYASLGVDIYYNTLFLNRVKEGKVVTPYYKTMIDRKGKSKIH